MRHAEKLSVRELEFLGLREVHPAAGGRSERSETELCEVDAGARIASPVRLGDALGELLDGLRPEWQARAACRGLGTAQFFPSKGGYAKFTLGLCERCEVAYECLGFGLETDSVGLWGGFCLRSGTV